MDSAIKEAFRIIYKQEPEGLERWEIAKKVMDKFGDTRLGYDLAREVVLEIINRTEYPNPEIRQELVGHAVNLATEFFPEFNSRANAEPHISEFERMDRIDRGEKMN
jgi:hypothetical protein